ncbi:MAG TPA: PfkB family carbohydrate kinase [Acidimicrobiales bacterium]
MSERASAGSASAGEPPIRVVIIGNLTIDDVIRADGTTAMGTVGGNSLHSACAARFAGASPSLVARKGTDFPSAHLEHLDQAGVRLDGLVEVDGPTVRNWVIYEEDGRRTWVYRTPRERSLAVAVTPEDLRDETFRDCYAVHIAAMPLANAEALVRYVRSHFPNVLITLDTHEDWVEGVEARLLDLAREVDVFLPSREELLPLTKTDNVTAAIEKMRAVGVRTFVVKSGADGAYVVDEHGVTHVAITATTVVDATGAGDSFCGAVVASLARGLSLVEAAQVGCYVATRAVESSGSTRLLVAAPSWDELRRRGGLLRTATLPPRDVGVAGSYAIDVMNREIDMIPEVAAHQLSDPLGAIGRLANRIIEEDIRHLYLTGCGDSFFAASASALAFNCRAQLDARGVHALDLARYGMRYLPEKSLIIALSFSGEVGRTTEVALQAREFGHPTVALTNSRESGLAKACDELLLLDVPTLGFSPGTSSYVSMLANLLLLSAKLALAKGDDGLQRELALVPNLARATLEMAADAVAKAAQLLTSSRWVSFLGAGPNEATARFGAAKLFEGCQMVGHPTNLEEWAHEEYFVTKSGDPVIVVNPTGASHDRGLEILSEIEYIGATPILVTNGPAVHGAYLLPIAEGLSEELSGLLTCLPLSQLGFQLARLMGKESYNFPNEAVKSEHYSTIHRVTVGLPA